MFSDNNMQNFISPTEIQNAGKVNFSPHSANDYITNEAYKTLRTNLLFCGTELKTILITSAQENDGKSTITSELAKSLADAGKRTLMIDADMRKSVFLGKTAQGSNFFGLSEFLSGQADLSQVLYNTQNDFFDVIFSGHFPPNPVELLSSKKFQILLDSSKKMYDYVLIDTPPLGTVIDAAVAASVCDACIIVISTEKTGSSDAIAVKEQLTKSGCKILGVILNDTNANHTGHFKKAYKYYSSYQASTKR